MTIEVDSKLDEMIEGYRAGLCSGSREFPECHILRSPAFKHGWRNGRDDRLQQPREVAETLRRRADMILGVYEITPTGRAIAAAYKQRQGAAK